MTTASHHISPEPSDPLRPVDVNTFRALYQQCQAGLFFRAYSLLQNQQEAEDVVTESFLKLWNSRDQFTNAGAAVNWLRVTTRNACLDLLKHKKFVQHSIGELSGQPEDWQYEDLLGDLLQQVYATIEQLPEKSRQVFRLRYIDGLKNEEIAETLGIRHQSVRNHLAEALKTLRLKLLDKDHLLPLLLLMLKIKD